MQYHHQKRESYLPAKGRSTQLRSKKHFMEYRVVLKIFNEESRYTKNHRGNKACRRLKKEWTEGSIVKFYFLFLPEFLCALRYAMYVHREKKKKMLKKMKLTDL